VFETPLFEWAGRSFGISSSTQLNSDLTDTRKWLGNLSDCTNLDNPPAEYGLCIVVDNAVSHPKPGTGGIMFYHVAGGSNSNGVELFLCRSSSAIYVRSRTNGTWSQWYQK